MIYYIDTYVSTSKSTCNHGMKLDSKPNDINETWIWTKTAFAYYI